MKNIVASDTDLSTLENKMNCNNPNKGSSISISGSVVSIGLVPTKIFNIKTQLS